MRFEEWFQAAGLPAEKRPVLRTKWAFLLRKGLTGREIAAVFDGFL